MLLPIYETSGVQARGVQEGERRRHSPPSTAPHDPEAPGNDHETHNHQLREGACGGDAGADDGAREARETDPLSSRTHVPDDDASEQQRSDAA